MWLNIIIVMIVINLTYNYSISLTDDVTIKKLKYILRKALI